MIRVRRTFWLALLAAFAAACATLQQLVALRQVEFSLAGVGSGRLAGVDLSRVRSYTDLSATDLARVALALARKDLPLEFQVDVSGQNPADNKVTATMIRLDWSLFLDDKQTISGVLDTTIAFPPGVTSIVPMQMRLNLLEFFDGPAQSLVDLAASFAGLRRDPTKVSIRAVPTINTPLGPISYPIPIVIVSRTVGG